MHGFKLIKHETINEIHSESFFYEHEKSGARLVFLKNQDENKVFSIGFRTMPEDSTGVPHIVEHCVLSGSRKYKTKEPFMDLIKGSLQTFLNAITYPDKTLYPVASRNEKDFKNLTDVYLDAVFFPAMLEDERIFMQEGWRYEIHDKKDPLTIQGVVYNEMKGAMSAPEDILEEARLEAAFPGTFYANNSGGDPYVIPELTYENFKAFHRKYYHPSNSYIFLYGDIEIDEYLEYMDSEYLSKFEKSEVPLFPVMPEITEPVFYRAPYNIPVGEDIYKKNYYSISWVFGKSNSVEDSIMLYLIGEILINSDAAPLRNAILAEDLCEDVILSSDELHKCVLTLVLKNAEKGKFEKIRKLVYDILKKTLDEGIDRKLTEASINKAEFSIKEGGGDFPAKGILYYITMMHHWIFDNDPVFILKTDETLKFLRDNISTGYFEKYIRDNILDNLYTVFVEIYPEEGLSLKKDKEVEEKLKAFKAGLSEIELDNIIKKAYDLKKMQETPDTKENLDTIPKLTRDEVSEKDGVIDFEYKEGKLPFVYREAFTQGISYFRVMTDISDFSKEELQYATLAAALSGSLDTEKFTYQELSNEIYLSLGDISFSTRAVEHDKTHETSMKFSFAGKALRENLNKVIPIFEEILLHTKWDSKKRIRELLQMMKARFETGIIYGGNSAAMLRAASHVSKTSLIQEIMSGIDFYYFIKNLNLNFDEKYESIVENLQKISEKILRKSEVIGMITAEKEDFNTLSSLLNDFVDDFSDGKIGPMKDFVPEKKNEAFIINSQVQFVSKAANFKKLGTEYNGVDNFISHFLSLDYLHNNIRAMGGAYGAGLVTDGSNLITYSYRDPHLKRTIEVYNGIGDALKTVNLSEEELTIAVIGTMNRRNPAMTERVKGELALVRYLTGVTEKDIIKTNKEVLEINNDIIKNRAEIYEKGMVENNLVVVGNKENIEAEKDLFDSVKTLTENEN